MKVNILFQNIFPLKMQVLHFDLVGISKVTCGMKQGFHQNFVVRFSESTRKIDPEILCLVSDIGSKKNWAFVNSHRLDLKST